MIKYFLKVTAIPTDSNPYKAYIHSNRTEYYGTRESKLSSFYIPTDDDLSIYGFGSLKAAETAKANKDANFTRDDSKFNNWIHTVEVMSKEI